MKKAIIILILITAIVALFTFNSSFVTGSDGGSATSTSAVIFAKPDYLTVRVKITIIPIAGYWINLIYSDGTQQRIATSRTFEVLLPKTGNTPQNFAENAPGQLILTNYHPCGATVVSNTTDSFIDSISSYSSHLVDIYWLRIDGNARVSVAYYGVPA